MRKSMTGALAAAAALTAGVVAAVGKPAPGAAPSPEPRLRMRNAREPNGTSFRSLRRAFNSGWAPPTVIVNLARKRLYMNSHARAMASLVEMLARR